MIVVSWPSLVMLGVMNDHCGSCLFLSSVSKSTKLLIVFRRVALEVMEE